jgi:hypothetical protein
MAIFATQSPEAGETGLGWSTSQSAAQTRSLLNSIIASLGSNDKLVFRGLYDYAGSIQTSRSDITLEGGGGANKGLHITDPTATTAQAGGPSIRFDGNRITFRDFTITSEPGFNNNRALLEHRNGSDFLFEWGKIDTDMSNQFTFRGAQRPIIRRSELSNLSGFAAGRSVNSYSVSCVGTVGAVSNGVFEYNYTHHWPHEHFKTVQTGTTGPTGWRMDNNFATNINRDFLDTTGGFSGTSPSNRASVSYNTLIGVNQSLIDAKWSGNDASNYPIGTKHTKYLLVEENEMYNCWDFITTSMNTNQLHLTLTAGPNYWRDACPEDFLCINNGLQNINRLLFIKHGLNVQLVNTRKYGSVSAIKLYTASEMSGEVHPDVSAAMYALHNASNPRFYTETGSTTGAARSVPTAPSFSYGPRSGEAEPSSDPLYVLSGSSFRTNTDLGASSADIMFGVHNANGADSDTATITVS